MNFARLRCAAAVAATVVVAGCTFHASTGSTGAMAKGDLEAGVQRVLTRWDVEVRSVKCDGNLPAKVGAEQTCWAKMGDGTNLKMIGITTKVDGEDIKYDVEVDGKVANRVGSV